MIEPPKDLIERYDLGTCCACGESGPKVRNIIMLDQEAPQPGTGWGCFVCSLPYNGAVAVLCDDCLGAEIIYVCDGRPNKDRMRLADLPFVPFEHDAGIHLLHRCEKPIRKNGGTP